MSHTTSLDDLEGDVLARMSAHRTRQAGRRALPVDALVVVCALAAGLGAGLFHHAPHNIRSGSESVVLADDASLAPSSLLASAQ